MHNHDNQKANQSAQGLRSEPPLGDDSEPKLNLYRISFDNDEAVVFVLAESMSQSIDKWADVFVDTESGLVEPDSIHLVSEHGTIIV